MTGSMVMYELTVIALWFSEHLICLIAQRELGVTWDVDLYGELLKIGGGKER